MFAGEAGSGGNVGKQGYPGPKGQRDKRGRGCLESVTCAGAGQGVREMVKLCTQVSALYREKLKLSKVQDYDTCRFPYIIPVVSINLRKKATPAR